MIAVKHPLLICFRGARRDNFTTYLFAHKGLVTLELRTFPPRLMSIYRGADKSLARPGRKQATATEDFDFLVSHL